MSDSIDEAQELDARLTEAALAQARRPRLHETPPGFNGRECIDCGEFIEPIRQLHSRVRCAECQEEHERVQRIKRRKGEE